MKLEKTGESGEKPRSKSEGLHGHIKENMLFEVFMDGRGMKYAEKHANILMISLLVVALTRLQNGVLDGLTHIPHIGFSLFFNTWITGERKQKTYVSLSISTDYHISNNIRQKCRYYIL